MEKMTITEALSEINLIKKKLEHKKKNTLTLLIKPDHTPDIYATEGGTPVFLKREFQSIDDLYRRFIKIRSAISKANIENDITLGERTQSIHDWLTWKREISKDETNFVNTVVTQTKGQLDEIGKSPRCFNDTEGKPQLLKVSAMVDYTSFVKKQEELAVLFEQLDGKLSLKNATIIVSIH